MISTYGTFIFSNPSIYFIFILLRNYEGIIKHFVITYQLFVYVMRLKVKKKQLNYDY